MPVDAKNYAKHAQRLLDDLEQLYLLLQNLEKSLESNQFGEWVSFAEQQHLCTLRVLEQQQWFDALHAQTPLAVQLDFNHLLEQQLVYRQKTIALAETLENTLAEHKKILAKNLASIPAMRPAHALPSTSFPQKIDMRT